MWELTGTAFSSVPCFRLGCLDCSSAADGDGGAAEIDWGERKAFWEAFTLCSLYTEIIDVGQILSQELLAFMCLFKTNCFKHFKVTVRFP